MTENPEQFNKVATELAVVATNGIKDLDAHTRRLG
jgi:UV DNA damage repair endonuclease